MERLGCERRAEGVEQRMKNADLVGSRRQAVDSELSQRIRDARDVGSLHDHLCTGQVSSIQAVDDDTGDHPLTSLRWSRRGRLRFLLAAERRGDHRQCQ